MPGFQPNSLQTELFHRIAGLAVANVHFAQGTIAHDEEHNHRHTPQPFRVDGKLANGLLEIVDTPNGERMRLRVSRHTEGLKATVAIQREGNEVETLALIPVRGDHHHLESAIAPAEPHEFKAKLHLTAGTQIEELSFSMAEPT